MSTGITTDRPVGFDGSPWPGNCRSHPAAHPSEDERVQTWQFKGVGSEFDKATIRQAISSLRPKVDVLIVTMHWGKEYVAVPEAAPGIAEDDPRMMARLVVDAGADLIIGNHPHWVQGIEMYKGKLVTYAHGNFIFDQMWSRETREGVVGKYTYYDDKLISVEFKPVLIENYTQPNFLDGPEAKTILDRMEVASRQMANVR